MFELKVGKTRYVHQPRLFLKVSKFQNEFMKSTFLPKYEPKIARIFAL